MKLPTYEEEAKATDRASIDNFVISHDKGEIAERIFTQETTIAELRAALNSIDIATEKWDANKLGDIVLQRKRWLKLGEIARNALLAKAVTK